ncbi:hypothetical protein CVT25_005974 [Psilocybe cyanescens]|uniref:Carbohydrate-binding module family 19 domain-containing protein n=1 Tax=Psilocybe cyanescens TaxID=93625 RepID=A0A409VM98_PSICY|nr:hypothetical protein CVT25_005974 [Psilocybe cyanescens]
MQISFVTLALVLTASAVSLPERAVISRRATIGLKNGQDAIALNNKFKTLTATSPCTAPEDACVGGKFAQCVGGKFSILGCAAGTVCGALPNTGAQDASASTVAAPADTAAAPPPTAETGAGNGGDVQTSLTLDPAVIAKGFANDGQDVPTAGQVASLTSTNNFINLCKTVNLPLTNGAQAVDGSCNPAPMGVIPAKVKMPSFTIKMAISNLETGNFVNAAENYFSAPQQINAQGIIRGHSHVVIEKLTSLDQTTTNDPTVFAFFKGLNAAAEGGILTADVDKGLPSGFYKLSSINTAANHQPVLVAVAQHGSLDDAIYFTVA